jgi:hypothetical protein
MSFPSPKNLPVPVHASGCYCRASPGVFVVVAQTLSYIFDSFIVTCPYVFQTLVCFTLDCPLGTLLASLGHTGLRYHGNCGAFHLVTVETNNEEA